MSDNALDKAIARMKEAEALGGTDRLRDDIALHDKLANSTEAMAQWFAFGHLPTPLQEVSRYFCELAVVLIENLPRNAERTVALRKLLEAKDCAVRAGISK